MSTDLVFAGGLEMSRNDSVLPFPHAAEEAQLSEFLERVERVLETCADPGDWELTPMDSLSPGLRAYLVERGLMTPVFSRETDPWKGFGLYRGGIASLEVNGRDHIRLMVSRAGEVLSGLWSTLDELDDVLESGLGFAYDERWGYLTARAEDAGTGLRAHSLVHLPALMVTGQLGSVAVRLIGKGITLSPVWGGAGGLFQVSNKGGMGRAELRIAEKVDAISRQLAEQEHVMRKRLLEENPVQVRDYVGRSLGVAQQAWSMTAEEALGLVSAVQSGVDMGVIELDGFTPASAFALMRRVQPGHIAMEELGEPDAEVDDPRFDEVRARLLRQAFGSARTLDRRE